MRFRYGVLRGHVYGEHHEFRLRGPGHESAVIVDDANVESEKRESAKASALALVDAIRMDLKARDIVTREAIENAVAVIMAKGGSTNAVLHFLALAHAAEVEWTIDDFERMRQKVPVICDLKPSGKYLPSICIGPVVFPRS